MFVFIEDYLSKKSSSWVFGASILFYIGMLGLASLVARGNVLISKLDYQIIASVILFFTAVIPFIIFIKTWMKNAVIFLWFLFVGTGNVLLGMYAMYLIIMSGLTIDAKFFDLPEMNHSLFSLVVTMIVPVMIILLSSCYVHLKIKNKAGK